MKTISRYIMTLALLITAVTGAWAAITTEDIGKVICTDGSLYATKILAQNDGKTAAAMIGYVDTENNKALAIALTDGNNNMDWTQASEYCTGMNTSLPVANGTWVLPTEEQWNSVLTLEEVVPGYEVYKSESLNTKLNAAKGNALDNESAPYWSATESSGSSYVKCFSFKYGMASVGTVNKTVADGSMTRAFLEIELSGIEVTTNAEEGETTFTEATFNMPAYDATADYELVRDITQKVDVEVRIDGAATERVRIAKDGDGHYKFVTKQENGWQFAAVDKLDNNKDLTDGELTYTFKMKEGNDYVAKNFETDICPGTWRLEATANAEKPYEGIAYSKDIVLYQGYEVTVGAGEYATFYKDEALYTEDADAELYTIASVTDTEAVLSDKIKVAPAETPLLVYNKGTEEKTFLLLPTTEQADNVTVADQFKGTLVDKDMPASKEGEDYYVCTGKAFVWVMNEGTIAANKCWLEIIAQAAGARANTRSITGGSDTTGIDAATRDDIDGNYYDLQGRKVEKLNRKGIYIKNGKKVIKH